MFAANFIPGMDRDAAVAFALPEDVRNPFFRFYVRPGSDDGGTRPCCYAIDYRFGIIMTVAQTGEGTWLVTCSLYGCEKHPCDPFRDDTVFMGEVRADTPLDAQFEAMSGIGSFKPGAVIERNPWMEGFMAGSAAFLSDDPLPGTWPDPPLSAWELLCQKIESMDQD